MVGQPVLLEFVFGHGGRVDVPSRRDFGCRQTLANSVVLEFLTDGKAGWFGIVAQESQDGWPADMEIECLPVSQLCIVPSLTPSVAATSRCRRFRSIRRLRRWSPMFWGWLG